MANLDKSWITSDRRFPEYVAGVNKFLDFAFKKESQKEIFCPCKKCLNRNWRDRETVRGHCFVYGFETTYIIWDKHGMAYPRRFTSVRSKGVLAGHASSSSAVSTERSPPLHTDSVPTDTLRGTDLSAAALSTGESHAADVVQDDTKTYTQPGKRQFTSLFASVRGKGVLAGHASSSSAASTERSPPLHTDSAPTDTLRGTDLSATTLSMGESHAADVVQDDTKTYTQPGKKHRGAYSGININTVTRNGTSKLEIAFLPESETREGLTRPLKHPENTSYLVRWIGKVIRDILHTPLRRIESLLPPEYEALMTKIGFYFFFTGSAAELDMFNHFCYQKAAEALKQWRRTAKDHWKKCDGNLEEQHKPLEGISLEDWAELIAYFSSDKQKTISKTNATNKACSKLVHTTGSTSFVDFEYKNSKVIEDGTRVWPTAAESWMMEHTHLDAEGKRVYLDPISEEIHDKIVEVQSQQETIQSSCSSSATVPMYPTDVVLSQHHNRRVGRGSSFAPFSTTKITRRSGSGSRGTEQQKVDELEHHVREMQAERNELREQMRRRDETLRVVLARLGIPGEDLEVFVSRDSERGAQGTGGGS